MTRQPSPNTLARKPHKRKHQKAVDTPITSQKTKRKRGEESSTLHSHPGEFRVVNATIVLPVPPVFANNLRGGVEEMLDSMVMR